MKKSLRNTLLLGLVVVLTVGMMPLAQADPVECEILSFSFTFDGQKKHALIDSDSEIGIITIVAPNGTDIRTQGLVPDIEIPASASITPAADTPQDFSKIVHYTVSIWDGDKPKVKEYMVRVMESKPAMARVISAFSLAGSRGVINELNKTILVDVPAGTDLTALRPVLVHNGLSVTPSLQEPQDFTQPVTYTIEMENGALEAYSVLVELAS